MLPMHQPKHTDNLTFLDPQTGSFGATEPVSPCARIRESLPRESL
jgi:hypothetical protein